MSPVLCNPAWIGILSALLTLAIALAVAFIAWRQWRTARERLKLDLFEKRLPVYEKTRDLLARRMARGRLESTEITEFGISTRVSRWLFNPSIADYLEGEIVKKLHHLNNLESEFKTLTDEAHRKDNVSKQREIENWLDEQRYKVIDKKFGAFLRLRH